MKNKKILFSFFFLSLTIFSAKIAFAELTSSSNEVVTRVGNPVSKPLPSRGNFIYYCQGNSSYQSHYLGKAGCGVTSAAMVLSTFGLTNYGPLEVDDIFQRNGWRPGYSSGSNMSSFRQSQWLKDLGFEAGADMVTAGLFNAEKAKEYIDNGSLIIGSSKSYPCANCVQSGALVDHIFVVDNVDLSTNPPTVSIRDPNNCEYGDGNVERQSNRIKKINDFSWYYAFPLKKIN